MATIKVFDGGLLVVGLVVVCFFWLIFAFFVWLLLPRCPSSDRTFFLSALMCFAAILSLSLMYVVVIFFCTSWHEGSLLSKVLASLSSKSMAFGSSMKVALVLVLNSSSIFRTTLKTSWDGLQSTPGLNSFSLSNILYSPSGLSSLCWTAFLHSSQMLEYLTTLFTM